METFIDKFIYNKALSENPISFNHLMPQRLGMAPSKKRPDISSGYPVRTGAELLQNGDIVFRMYAKDANKVEVELRNVMNKDRYKLEMIDRGDGVFEGTLPYDPSYGGPKSAYFCVDGVSVLNPYAPISFGTNRAKNYIEIPDSVTADYIVIKDVPHGSVTREIFYSETIGEWERCLVYTPPEYQKGGEYPVLYLQCGAGENETCWVYSGKLPYILDNLLSEGKCVPFIVVMNDSMIKLPHEATVIDSFDGITGIITRDCREFIENRYRVKKDKWNRAIAGASLGSMQASYIGFNNPELYSHIGLLSGFMRRRDNHPTYEENPHLDILKDEETIKNEYRLFFRSMGDHDGHYNEFIEDDGFCAQYGIDKLDGYVRKSYDGQFHDWGVWRRALYDFSQVVFR